MKTKKTIILSVICIIIFLILIVGFVRHDIKNSKNNNFDHYTFDITPGDSFYLQFENGQLNGVVPPN